MFIFVQQKERWEAIHVLTVLLLPSSLTAWFRAVAENRSFAVVAPFGAASSQRSVRGRSTNPTEDLFASFPRRIPSCRLLPCLSSPPAAYFERTAIAARHVFGAKKRSAIPPQRRNVLGEFFRIVVVVERDHIRHFDLQALIVSRMGRDDQSPAHTPLVNGCGGCAARACIHTCGTSTRTSARTNSTLFGDLPYRSFRRSYSRARSTNPSQVRAVRPRTRQSRRLLDADTARGPPWPSRPALHPSRTVYARLRNPAASCHSRLCRNTHGVHPQALTTRGGGSVRSAHPRSKSIRCGSNVAGCHILSRLIAVAGT